MITADQRFLLLPAPTFDLPFRGDGVGQMLKFLMEHKLNRPTRGGVPAKSTGVVLHQSMFKARAS